MGLGRAFVVRLASSRSLFLGAVFVTQWTKAHRKSADASAVPIASGAVAGESPAAAGHAVPNSLRIIVPG